MKRLVVVEVDVLSEACGTKCMFLRLHHNGFSCTLFEKTLSQIGSMAVRHDDCLAAEVKPGDEVG